MTERGESTTRQPTLDEPQIVELCTETEVREAYPVMRELRDHLSEQAFVDLVAAMRPDGYRLLALRDAGAIVAVAGIARRTSLADGRHVWVHDLVTRASARSRGYGRRLLAAVEQLARREGCARVGLSSGVQRLDAHRFYEQHMHYERPAYTFKKTLAPE